MAEINKRNLVDETAKVYAENTLANEPTPLLSTGMPAKIIRASIANTNLLSNDGDLFVGTGSTYTETIDGTEYTYAKIAKKNQSELFVDGLNSTATNVGLAASVGKFIDDRLHISTANNNRSSTSIVVGGNASSFGENTVSIGNYASVDKADGVNNCDNSIAIGGSAKVLNGNSIAIGPGGEAHAEYCIELGSGINETAYSFQVGGHQMLDLNTGKIPWARINQTGGNSTLALGGTVSMIGDTVYGASSAALKGFGVAIGASAKSIYSGDVAIGYDSYCRGGGNVTVGYLASIGRGNEYSAQNCIAIGGNAIVSTENGAVTNSIQLGIGTNTSGGLKVFDWQLLNWQGKIPTDRFTLQYQHNLTLSAMSNGSQLFYLSFSIITSSGVSLSNNYGGQSAVVFLEDLADILSKNGYSDSGRFRCPCTGYDVANTSQMMWLSGNGSTIKYYYVQNNSIQSRELSIGSTNTGIYVDDKVFAGF